jgi:hypothetical protein
MKKETYAINIGTNKEPKTVNGYTETIETKSGFIFVGYHWRKDSRTWAATDLKTGCCVTPHYLKKKDDAISFVHNNADFIHNLIEKALQDGRGWNIGAFREWVNARNLNQTNYF